MEERTIEKFEKETGCWESISFDKLVDGDIFRIFDGDKRYVNIGDGNNVWIAEGTPYINADGVLSIQTIY